MAKPADFAARLIALRERAGLTSYALAQKAGIGLPMLRRMELGQRKPSWDSVQKLAVALGVTTDAFRAS